MDDAHANSLRVPDCPRCGYELRGQKVPENLQSDATGRCPECALVFVWAILLDPISAAPKWFVETQYTSVFMNSLRTTVRSIFPWQFWRSIQMSFWRRNGRALAAVVIGVVFLWLTMAASGLLTGIVFDTFAMPYMGSQPGRYMLALQQHTIDELIDAIRPENVGLSGSPWLVATYVAYGVVPLAMLLLPQTLKKAKVLPGHMVRIVIYSIAPMLLMASVPYVIRCFWWMFDVAILKKQYSTSGSDFVIDNGMWMRPLLAYLAIQLTWGFACSRYLKLPTPWLVTLLVGLIAVIFGVLVATLTLDHESLFFG